MEVIISIDDYNPGNIELAELIKSYGLEDKAIFFIDLGLKETIYNIDGLHYEETDAVKQIRELYGLGFEVGGHNLTHDNSLKDKHIAIQEAQILGCKEVIEDITGKPCKHYAYNRGRSNEHIRQLVKEAGYEDARGTTVKMTTYKPEDKFNMYTTVHMFERSEYKGEDWLSVAEKGLNTIAFGLDPEHCYFHIWGHYSELSRPGEMDKFKKILKYINENTTKSQPKWNII